MYDRRKIMTTAWDIKRNNTAMSFGDCLRRAWAAAKQPSSNNIKMDVSHYVGVVDGKRKVFETKIMVTLSGGTFPVKDQIKSLGFNYDPSDRTWVKVISKSTHVADCQAIINTFDVAQRNFTYSI